MNNLRIRTEDKPEPFPRVYYGEEPDGPNGTMDFNRNRPPLRLNIEAETFWAGRNSAARLSTRVAA